MTTARIIGQPCRPRQLCRLWRECDRCCRIRQAKFADRAEAAALMMIVPGLTVLIPHDGTRASAEKLRRWYAEKVKPLAAVWSIEHGRHGTGYHINIIAEHVADLAPPGARVLASPIRTTVRGTAAYITKRSQTPPAESTQTRNTGYFGQVIPLLANSHANGAIVRAAALQTLLQRTEPPPASQPQQNTAATATPTKTECREIAMRHLDRLRQINEQLNGTGMRRAKGIINSAHTARFNPPKRYR